MQKMQRLINPTVLEQKLFGATVTREAWTPATVREDLPDVTVRFRGREVQCITFGRQCDFARVQLQGARDVPAWEFSWDAIARSLNTGRPLRV